MMFFFLRFQRSSDERKRRNHKIVFSSFFVLLLPSPATNEWKGTGSKKHSSVSVVCVQIDSENGNETHLSRLHITAKTRENLLKQNEKMSSLEPRTFCVNEFAGRGRSSLNLLSKTHFVLLRGDKTAARKVIIINT